MASSLIGKTDPIIIIGAGVFGLSTAIHLAQKGYEEVKVFDSNRYEETRYDYSASAVTLHRLVRLEFALLASTAEWKRGN